MPVIPKGRNRLSRAIGWMGFGLAVALGLSYYKTVLLDRVAREAMDSLHLRHSLVVSAFQANYYFFYPDQFVPQITGRMAEIPNLRRIWILTPSGSELFDSADPGLEPHERQPTFSRAAEVVSRLNGAHPVVFQSGFEVKILMPGTQFGVLYEFDASAARRQLAVVFLAALFLAFVLQKIISHWLRARVGPNLKDTFQRFWGLRFQLLATIVAINLATGAIVFLTLTELQTREQTTRIRKEAQLFSEFTVEKVVADFTSLFYFNFQDKFLPAVRSIIASNENLIGLRVVSGRTRLILFDSEATPGAEQNLADPAQSKVDWPESLMNALNVRGLATRETRRGGEPALSIVKAWKNERDEPLFYVEYLFSYETLRKSIQATRRQILVDLIPSLLLALGLAAIFTQLLIRPIRRLVDAILKVSAGDFDVTVDVKRKDELGELVQAFNSMAAELRKKQELRKYLSESTYRQVMSAQEQGTGEAATGGKRVRATILLSDIRDFVQFCDHQDAEEVTAMLNEYFTEMVEIVHRHGGEVDKFIGDAMLAVFYAGEDSQTIRPVDSTGVRTSAESALAAIHCGLEMRKKLEEFNHKRELQQKPPIEIGVGISHGELISGPVGSRERRDFTVIGSTVNLAARIEKLSKNGKHTRIVFSDHVEKLVRGSIECVELTRERIRGKDEDVIVYELVRIGDLETLLAEARSSDVETRRRSVELLGQSRNPASLPVVAQSLRDASEQVRLVSATAIARLASFGNPTAADALLGQLRRETDLRVMASLLQAIGKICPPDRIIELAPYLEHPDDRVVANTIEAMGQARDPRCSDLILPKLASMHNRVKANAAMALFAAGHFEVIDSIKPMLMHSDPLMRSSAAFAIGELTLLAHRDRLLDELKRDPSRTKRFLAELQECVPMLVALLKDPHAVVKRQSLLALGKIKDKSAVLPMIDAVNLEVDTQEMIQVLSQALRTIGSHRLIREVLERLH